MSTPTPPFLSLPNELFIAIISYLPDRASLIALAQTCSKLQTLAEAQLFKDIYIRDWPSIIRLAQLLEQPPERVLAVENLEATPGWNGPRGIEQMPGLAGRMVRLRRLKVEIPSRATAFAWSVEECMKEYVEFFELANRGVEGSWGCLTSFTLHSHGTKGRYYSVESILPVLLSPTLKYLHLSCLDIACANQAFASLSTPTVRTPLETLILERCIEPSSHLRELQAILSRPTTLRSFTLLLDVDFGRQQASIDADSLSRARLSDFLEALQQQSDSLSYLRYTHHPTSNTVFGSPEYSSTNLTSSLNSLRQSSSGLSTFKRLRALDIGYRTNLSEILLDASLAPPNLLTLGLSGIGFDSDYGTGETWRHLSAYIPTMSATTNFTHLRLHTIPSCSQHHLNSRHGMSSQFFYNAYTHTWPRSGGQLLAIANHLRGKASVQLVGTRHLPGVFPPFLHGQGLDKEVVVFDSRKSVGEGRDRRFEQEAYVPDGASGWSGPFLGLGNLQWRE